MLTLTKEQIAVALSDDNGRECLSWLISRWCQRHGVTVRSGIVAAIVRALEDGELTASWDGISEELLEIEPTPTLAAKTTEEQLATFRSVLTLATQYLSKHEGELPS